ncbi:MAG: antibiotic biosynthesis monooxygenase [Flavobacteriales bacterium]|jgi:heme-degrading monooxygenase HmoA|nr:antibiotic biosynthesis monooxygenase [Flavobacteriales bacterium]MDG1348748.1 antibiotic biosynthesis monooxygenase [Flavobacteriales bacterium]
MIANTPQPPYIAAIFTSIRTDVEEGYEQMNELTFKELESIEGYLGYEAFRDENGFGVNVSYWKDMEALKNWRDNTLHQKAQELGKEKWYTNYKLRICTVERDYEFEK